MARVTFVEKARKAQGKCRCGAEIAAGDPYFHWTPFRSRKQVRCKDHRPRPSEYATNSDKISRLYGAQESLEDALSEWAEDDEDASSIQEALTSAAQEAADVRDEYQEALDAWENGNEQLQERVDAAEAWTDALEEAANDVMSMEPELTTCEDCEDEAQDTSTCPTCDGTGEVKNLEAFHEEVEARVNDVSGELEL